VSHLVPRIVSACILIGSLAAGGEPKPSPSPHVFDRPMIHVRQASFLHDIAAMMARREYDRAELLLRQAILLVPDHADSHYNLACVFARQGRRDESLAALAKAVECGFHNAQHMQADADLESLRADDRFPNIVAQARKQAEKRASQTNQILEKIVPGTIEDGQVLVTEANTAWHPDLALLHAFFKLDRNATADQPIAVGLGKAGDLLRTWYAEGTAAGNHGDLYDNHDSDHSNMDVKALPQFTRVEYSEEARKRQLHHGVQLSMVFNAITIGNSSTAITSGDFWRSQARFTFTYPRGPSILYWQYVNRHMYFYPEHRDHDPPDDQNGHGDVFPANTPYMIISQGSSGSDRPFLTAVGATLAAFRPEVKQKLAKSGYLMPAVQMIFRTSNKTVAKPADYLTGKAHPTVFDGSQIDVEKMVTMAHDMQVDALPPMVLLAAVEEDQPVLGRDYFDVAPRFGLFDTPCAIARLVKTTAYDYRMVVSAEQSKDLDDKPLTYHWALLRGDSARVRINKLNPAGSRAEIIVSYHERLPIAPDSKLQSNRVDIGVFVHNGRYYSAPGFVCLQYLANERRVYDEHHRIQVVDYTDPDVKDNYVDSVLDLRKDWRDEYHYADDGTLLGWTRIRADDRQEFAADGQLVLEKDADGKPTKTTRVRYVGDASSADGPVRSTMLQQVSE